LACGLWPAALNRLDRFEGLNANEKGEANLRADSIFHLLTGLVDVLGSVASKKRLAFET